MFINQAIVDGKEVEVHSWQVVWARLSCVSEDYGRERAD